MTLKNFLKKYWTKALITVFLAVPLALGIDLYIKKIQENEFLKKQNDELLKEYNKLSESNNAFNEFSKSNNQVLQSVKKIKIIDDVDCSSLESICFAETDEIKKDYSAQQGTYAMYYQKDGFEFNSSSNGFFITEDGFFLTNFHSCDAGLNKNSLKHYVFIIESNFNLTQNLNLVAYSESSDLALFKIDEKEINSFKQKLNFKNITLSNSLSDLVLKYRFSDSLWNKNIGNYPIEEVEIKNIEKKSGKLTINSKNYEGDFLETNEVIAKSGMSGSPLYDSSGNLVGITCSVTDKCTYFVPSDVIFSFLQDYIYSQKKNKK